MSCYSKKQFHHLHDYRTEDEKLTQGQMVEEIVNNNLRLFSINLTPKRKQTYYVSPYERIDVQEGWYCNISDNRKHSSLTFLTLHGGQPINNHYGEWAGIQYQMGGSHRWINLAYPGYDGEDQRRGSYIGSMEQLVTLIYRVLVKIKVKKVILVTHSLGSMIGTFFHHLHPEMVSGFVNLAGLVSLWYPGFVQYKLLSAKDYQHFLSLGENENEARKELSKQKLKTTSLYNFSERAPIQMRMACIKFSYLFPSQGESRFIRLYQDLPVPRLVFYGAKDPLHTKEKVQHHIYGLCYGESCTNSPTFQKRVAQIKGLLEMRMRTQFGVEIQAEKIQQYLCYIFADTGHNVHRRRPEEVSKALKIYALFIEIYEKCQSQFQAKL